MLLLSLDFETTGLDKQKDLITEVGAELWSTTFGRAMETASYFVDCELPISKEVSDITGITAPMLKKFGRSEVDAIEDVVYLANKADAVIGQNVIQFDKHFLDNAGKRLNIVIPEKLWIDTRTDLPPQVESKSLSYMAADHGFLNPFPHNAVADALTVLKIVALYDIDEIVKRAKEPVLVVRAHQKFDDNHLAKKLKFGFKANLGKAWLKVIKQSDLPQLTKDAAFDISVEKDITPQSVWYD